MKLFICFCLSFYSFKTVQNNLNSLQSDISQQSDTLLSKMSSQTDMMTELEEKVKKVNICLRDHYYCKFTEVKDFGHQ